MRIQAHIVLKTMTVIMDTIRDVVRLCRGVTPDFVFVLCWLAVFEEEEEGVTLGI